MRMTHQPTIDPNGRTSEALLATANTYRLLSRLWLREVDQELTTLLNAEPLRSAYLDVGGTLPPTRNAPLDFLAQDFCQLFIGPQNHLPPVQSVWTSGTFQSDTADSMRIYLQILRDGNEHSIVDHLGVQLYVMATVLEHAATAEQDEVRQTIASIATRFFAEHLAWPSGLIKCARDQAKSDFYESLMRVTADFLSQESTYWVIKETAP